MEDITGMRLKDIIDLDKETKQYFGRTLIKFGVMSAFLTSCVNGDLHMGNVFFYLNNDDPNKPKYQVGIIDYGLCFFPSPKNQMEYYKFFYNIQVKSEYNKIKEIVPILIKNKEYYYTMNVERRENFLLAVKDCIKNYGQTDFDIDFFMNLSKIFKSFNILFTTEFNNICMSLQITRSLGTTLCESIYKTQHDIMNDFIHLHKLLEIE